MPSLYHLLTAITDADVNYLNYPDLGFDDDYVCTW